MQNNQDTLEQRRELAAQIHAKTQELAALAAQAMKLRMVVSVQVEPADIPDNTYVSLKVTESIIY